MPLPVARATETRHPPLPVWSKSGVGSGHGSGSLREYDEDRVLDGMTGVGAWAAVDHDSAAVGTALGWLAFNLFIVWATSGEGFRPRIDLDAFRIDPISRERQARRPRTRPDARLAPGRLARITVGMVLAAEALLLLLGALLLHLPAVVLVIWMVAVVPVSITVSLAYVGRFPSERR